MFEGPGRTFVISTSAVLAVGGLWLGSRPPVVAPALVQAPPPAPAPPSSEDMADDDGRAFSFRVPSGEPTALGCGDARRIIDQVRIGLAYDADPVAPKAFAESTADWLDPHEMWALAADAPTPAALNKVAPELLAELEGSRRGDCAAARTVGAVLVPWLAELRARFDVARTEAARDGVTNVDAALHEPLVAPGTTNIVARDLASSIGKRVGAFEAKLGAAGHSYAESARRRFFPELDAEGWSHVVLAAAVRAYVPLVDPHGAWAPFDEEASVYEVELSARPPERLWQGGDFTAVGFRVRDGVASPLAKGDVLLSIAGVPIAGLPLEQLDQLGYAAADAHTPTSAVVVRDGESSPRLVQLAGEDDSAGPPRDRDPLPAEKVHFGDGDALVVAIRDVRDDLGEQLGRAIKQARTGERPLSGVVLDLRGNGGGSTDGAIEALGLFMPGVTLFPMKRRDGTIEMDRAPEPNADIAWSGPVATLVDSGTASAAEMIAGAIGVYRRGPSVGAMTYGKGCAQEYVDDDARTGVLRLTTLLYALPDGSPVQRVGIAPTIRVPFVGTDNDREALLPHAPPTWRGPDVRERVLEAASYTWPNHGGVVGPCKDADVCRALHVLGTGGKRLIAAKR